MSNLVSMVKVHSWNLFPEARIAQGDRFRNGKRVIKRHALDFGIGIVLIIVAAMVLAPKAPAADAALAASFPDAETTDLLIQEMMNDTLAHGSLPEVPAEAPKRTVKIPLTAYTSDVAQTDATPCITASGLDVCQHGVENIVAANFLPMGTRVRIPELYGDRVFYVEDRMNQRYFYKMDLWMKDVQDARQFGVKYATVEIF